MESVYPWMSLSMSGSGIEKKRVSELFLKNP